MKAKKHFIVILIVLVAVCLAITAEATPPKYKMTTQVPDNVLIPDKVDTRLGTLEFFDGVPTAETSAKVWDHLDFSRAVEAMILTTPAASLSGFRRGIREFGPDNETAIISEWGDMPMFEAVLSTMGTSRTTSAAVGIMQVARNVKAIRPAITASGPRGPTICTTALARYWAAPLLSSAVPRGSIPTVQYTCQFQMGAGLFRWSAD